MAMFADAGSVPATPPQGFYQYPGPTANTPPTALAPGAYGTMAPQFQVPEPAGGGAPAAAALGKPFLRVPRRRLNLMPIIVCALVPWLFFSGLYASQAFPLRYSDPLLTNCILAAGALLVLASALVALDARFRFFTKSEREPTWAIFFALAMAVAFLMAFVLGGQTYSAFTKPYMDFHGFNSYVDIDPSRMRGQQLMDAGSIAFKPGARLDLPKASGFKNGGVYCVVPITIGDSKLPTYDFWAVGRDCCSSTHADFHCGKFNNPSSNGGLRFMGGREFYRLAVQEAEAAYHIKAQHPLFFEWMPDPASHVDGWRDEAFKQYILWVCVFLVAMGFVVVVTTLFFTKFGLF